MNEGSKTLFVGGLAYQLPSQLVSFPMEPNVLMESSQIFQGETPDTIDEQMKINGNHGALTGLYLNWGIYIETGYNNPDAPDFQPSTLEANFALYNDDHVSTWRARMPPPLAADAFMLSPGGSPLTNSPSVANCHQPPERVGQPVRGASTGYYPSLFGPAAINMEDYTAAGPLPRC